MFTAGLELLMCAAELSGPTRPSSGRCLVGGVLSPAWLLLFVERFSCWGGRQTGYSCFTPGLVCPRSPSHPLPAFSPVHLSDCPIFHLFTHSSIYLANRY